MERRNFAQVLKDAKVDITREYYRLYAMFNKKTSGTRYTFRDICEQNFDHLPFKGTCITLKDFDDYYGFNFAKEPIKVDINYLINFCEYAYNLAMYNGSCPFNDSRYSANDIIIQINKIIELIGYKEAKQDGFTIFVPKSQPAIIVSEMLPSDLSYKVIEYNHHSMKGDLARKQATLKLLADQLEAKQKELNKLDKQFKSDLFYLLNNMNIRHNNIEPTSKEYRKAVAEMPKEELEQWYDEIYDMCLYAFMTLDQAERNATVKELKTKIEENNR